MAQNTFKNSLKPSNLVASDECDLDSKETAPVIALTSVYTRRIALKLQSGLTATKYEWWQVVQQYMAV